MTGQPRAILQIVTTIDVGGAENHLLALCRGLVEAGHRVDVVYLKGRGTLADRFLELRIVARKIPIDGPMGAVGCFLGLFRQCHRGGYDVVHTHLLKADFLGALAARLARVPVVIASKHNDEPQLGSRLVRRLHAWSSRFDDRVLHASEHIAAYMIERGGVDPDRSVTIHYGVDPDRFERDDAAVTRAALEVGDTETLVVCVARLVPRKGHVTLVEAIAEIADECPRLRLLIVGEGPARPGIEARVESLGLAGRVVLIGERLDVPALLAAADLFVLASTAEGLGLVFLEAMASRLPVVATRVGGIPEIVSDGETGILVPPGDVPALARALARVARDSSLRRRLADAGRGRAVNRFTEARMVERVSDVYERCLDEC